ncbi:MAG: DUF58 domain-containing protein [Caldilineaceae bacterium]|nr:DUF58 domain-containing protein [Caldilineaceae bacterium]
MTKRVYLLIGVIALVSVLMRNELLFLISILLGLVAAAAQLWARYCLQGVTYQRRFGSTRLYLGEETEFAIEIVNAKPLPLPWLRADDAVPGGLHVATQQVEERPGGRHLVSVLSLRWYERVTRRYRLQALRRGAWTFDAAHLRSGDIFGFNIQRATVEAADTVLVYPRIVPVTALGLTARHPLGDYRSPRRVIEDPLRMMGVRDYAQGDNFRHIHWKATARRQGLQTKVFEPSANRPVAIFLNVNTTEMYYQGYDWELREYAITVAASVARHLWEFDHPLGFYTNALMPGSARHVRIRPRAHPGQLEEILAALARIDEGWGRWPLDRLLQMEATSLPYGATLVVISAVMNPGLAQTITDLRRREFGVTLLTLGAAGPAAPIANVDTHHIEGREEWHDVAALELA